MKKMKTADRIAKLEGKVKSQNTSFMMLIIAMMVLLIMVGITGYSASKVATDEQKVLTGVIDVLGVQSNNLQTQLQIVELNSKKIEAIGEWSGMIADVLEEALTAVQDNFVNFDERVTFLEQIHNTTSTDVSVE